jgi:hypothetical protein
MFVGSAPLADGSELLGTEFNDMPGLQVGRSVSDRRRIFPVFEKGRRGRKGGQ